MGLFSEGLTAINQSLKLNPSYFKGFRARGRIYVGLELYESAVEDFLRAFGCNLSNVDALELEALIAEMGNVGLMAEREADKEKDYYKILGEWTLAL